MQCFRKTSSQATHTDPAEWRWPASELKWRTPGGHVNKDLKKTRKVQGLQPPRKAPDGTKRRTTWRWNVPHVSSCMPRLPQTGFLSLTFNIIYKSLLAASCRTRKDTQQLRSRRKWGRTLCGSHIQWHPTSQLPVKVCLHRRSLRLQTYHKGCGWGVSRKLLGRSVSDNWNKSSWGGGGISHTALSQWTHTEGWRLPSSESPCLPYTVKNRPSSVPSISNPKPRNDSSSLTICDTLCMHVCCWTLRRMPGSQLLPRAQVQ